MLPFFILLATSSKAMVLTVHPMHYHIMQKVFW